MEALYNIGAFMLIGFAIAAVGGVLTMVLKKEKGVSNAIAVISDALVVAAAGYFGDYTVAFAAAMTAVMTFSTGMRWLKFVLVTDVYESILYPRKAEEVCKPIAVKMSAVYTLASLPCFAVAYAWGPVAGLAVALVVRGTIQYFGPFTKDATVRRITETLKGRGLYTVTV